MNTLVVEKVMGSNLAIKNVIANYVVNRNNNMSKGYGAFFKKKGQNSCIRSEIK